jgi:hypothetical protein
MRHLQLAFVTVVLGLGACDQAPQAPPPAPTFTRAELAPLFGAMEGQGPDAQGRYESALRRVLDAPGGAAALGRFYDGLPAGAGLGRWKAVYLATQLSSPEVVPFLERVALAKLPEAPPAPASGGHEEGNSSDDNARRRASIGLALRYLAGDRAASGAIEHILRDGDREVALAAAIELFGADRLSPAWAELLRRRGIPSHFARVSEAEQRQAMQIPPADLVSKRPRSKQGATPPAISPTTR